MAVLAGRHQLGPDRGRILLRTFRDGLAAQAGHDLTIEATRWSGVLEVNGDLNPAALDIRIDMGALVVREGTGGVKPLTDRDRREIAVTARKLLRADRHPTATFTASSFEPGQDGGGVVHGTLSLAGTDRPLRLQVVKDGEAAYHVTASVRQSDFGTKPYAAFLGVLKVSDAVGIVVDAELPRADPGAGAGEQP